MSTDAHTHTHTAHTHIHTAHTHTHCTHTQSYTLHTHTHYTHITLPTHAHTQHTHTCTAAHSEALASTLLELHALQDMLGVSGTEIKATPVREDVETVEQQLAELEVNLRHTNCSHLL